MAFVRIHLRPAVTFGPAGATVWMAGLLALILVATGLAGMRPLPDEVVDHIVGKTDGVPLYVEELTKTILAPDILRETGERFELTGPLSSLAIPETLQESLMARLDRLPQVRELAQLGSVLGREFAYEMLSGRRRSRSSRRAPACWAWPGDRRSTPEPPSVAMAMIHSQSSRMATGS